MKTLLIILAVLSQVLSSQTCLYCKRKDTNAGFLFTYSFCSDSADQKCIADSWNYINPKKKCLNELVPGWQLDIDNDCESEDDPGSCQNFVSSKEFKGEWFNVTETIPSNSKCTISLDATAAVGRVIVDNNSELGVLVPGYVIGQPITVSEGQIRKITIYNGGENGPLTYTLSFSAAHSKALNILLLVSVLFSLSI